MCLHCRLCIEIRNVLESPEGYRLLLLRYKSMALLLKAIVVSTRNSPGLYFFRLSHHPVLFSCRKGIRQMRFIDVIWDGLKFAIELYRFSVNTGCLLIKCFHHTTTCSDAH